MSNAIIEFLSRRRSVKADLLAEPGPTADEIELILTIASRVPDHKKLAPWRFVILEDEARFQLGEVVAQVCQTLEPDASPVRLETERNRLARAPLVIAVVSRVVEKPGAPEWEQVLSAGAAAFNLCLAANALGYGTCWLTEWISYDGVVCKALGLEGHERIAGFIHVGTATTQPDERPRPNLADIVTHWRPQMQ